MTHEWVLFKTLTRSVSPILWATANISSFITARAWRFQLTTPSSALTRSKKILVLRSSELASLRSWDPWILLSRISLQAFPWRVSRTFRSMNRPSNDHKLWWFPNHHTLRTLAWMTTSLKKVKPNYHQSIRIHRLAMMLQTLIWSLRMLSLHNRRGIIQCMHTLLRRRVSKCSLSSSRQVIQAATLHRRWTTIAFPKLRMFSTPMQMRQPTRASSTTISSLQCNQVSCHKPRLHSIKFQIICQWWKEPVRQVDSSLVLNRISTTWTCLSCRESLSWTIILSISLNFFYQVACNIVTNSIKLVV